MSGQSAMMRTFFFIPSAVLLASIVGCTQSGMSPTSLDKDSAKWLDSKCHHNCRCSESPVPNLKPSGWIDFVCTYDD